MTLSITYTLEGIGWSSCTIETENAKVKLTASYLCDALGNLVLAAVTVLSGFDACTFKFDEEPGEYRWVIATVDHSTIQVDVLEFEEWRGRQPNSEGKLLFTFRCTPFVFAKAVHGAALAVLEQHGIDGYEEQWRYEFPEREITLLGGILADCEHT